MVDALVEHEVDGVRVHGVLHVAEQVRHDVLGDGLMHLVREHARQARDLVFTHSNRAPWRAVGVFDEAVGSGRPHVAAIATVGNEEGAAAFGDACVHVRGERAQGLEGVDVDIAVGDGGFGEVLKDGHAYAERRFVGEDAQAVCFQVVVPEHIAGLAQIQLEPCVVQF